MRANHSKKIRICPPPLIPLILPSLKYFPTTPACVPHASGGFPGSLRPIPPFSGHLCTPDFSLPRTPPHDPHRSGVVTWLCRSTVLAPISPVFLLLSKTSRASLRQQSWDLNKKFVSADLVFLLLSKSGVLLLSKSWRLVEQASASQVQQLNKIFVCRSTILILTARREHAHRRRKLFHHPASTLFRNCPFQLVLAAAAMCLLRSKRIWKSFLNLISCVIILHVFSGGAEPETD